MNPERAKQMLQIAAASPRAVFERDRDAWLELFTPDASIEDPIGGNVYADSDARIAFWEAFVAPQTRIELLPIRDFIGVDQGGREFVVRQVDVRTTMPSAPDPVMVPTIVVYQIDARRIASLRAFWSVSEATRGLLGQGLSGWRQMFRQNSVLMRQLGPVGVARFAAAVRPAISERQARSWARALLEQGEVRGTRLVRGAISDEGTSNSPRATSSYRLEHVLCAGNEAAIVVAGEKTEVLWLRARDGRLERALGFESVFDGGVSSRSSQE